TRMIRTNQNGGGTGVAQQPRPTIAAAAVQETLLAIVSEKTGYPSELLEPAMRLDADLGIDSIKLVEILSALQEQLPDAPVIKPGHLGTLQTLGDIVTFLTVPACGPEVSVGSAVRTMPAEDGPHSGPYEKMPAEASFPLQRLIPTSVALDEHQPREP